MQDSDLFPILQKFVNECQATTSSTDKQAILPRYPELKEILHWVYNPYLKFNISSDKVKKQATSNVRVTLTLIDLLKALNERAITGQAAADTVSAFAASYPAHSELILNIIDKDLKIRVDVKSINKAFPNLIPTFEVALASSYEDHKAKVSFNKDTWYASRKMDGCRLLTIIDASGNISCMSRTGNEFLSLERLKDAIRTELPDLRSTVFDGEICLVDDKGDEHFDWVMKEIRKQDGHQIANPVYKIFDVLTLKEFGDAFSAIKLSTRLRRFTALGINSKTFFPVEQVKVESAAHLESLFASAEGKGWEGLIIRKDAEYEGKRSRTMLKVKSFSDAEFVVQGMETGPFRFVRDHAEAEEEMLTAVWITYTSPTTGLSNRVDVGSGFSLEERKAFFADPSKIVGQTITVKWFEESVSKDTGLPSLRFPTLLAIHGRARVV